MRFAPPPFEGQADPSAAKKWLGEMWKRFALLFCSEEQKVSLAAYMLQGEAHLWWLSMLQMQKLEDPPMVWAIFEKVFYENFFPKALRQKKQREFTLLKQGEMTVGQYASRFVELSRFALSLVVEEEMKANKFQWGLKPFIRSKVALFHERTYMGVLDYAMIVEREYDELTQARE